MPRMRDDGSQLEKLRHTLDISVIEIAQAADLHPQTVYKVLGNLGAGRNSVKRVRKVLYEFGASLKSKSAG